jgi:UDP-glucose 4-epimerase
MRILLTGGMGFVGGRLAQFLAHSSSHEICIATRNPVGPVAWLPQAQVRRIDWSSSSELRTLCDGFDVVAHLAGVNAPDAAADPVMAYEFNVVATARLVQAAIQAGVRRMLYLSTAHVYGSPLQGTVDERLCPFPVHPYAISHRAAEDIVRMAHATGKLEGTAVRLSNAFGAPAHITANCWMLLVNDLCRQAVLDHRLVLNSDGQQYRDFMPMQVACAALAHLLEVPAAKLGDGLFNLGGNLSARVLDVAMRIATLAEDMMGRKPELLRRPDEPGPAPVPLHYDIERLRASGFSMNAQAYMDAEILQLLEFCKLNRADLESNRASCSQM